jgi:hypothetical protein
MLNNNTLNEFNYSSVSAAGNVKAQSSDRKALLLAFSSACHKLQTFPFGMFFGEKGLVLPHPYKVLKHEPGANPTPALSSSLNTNKMTHVLNTTDLNS